MEIKRKKLTAYDDLFDRDIMYFNNTFESMYNALQDADENNYCFTQILFEQNKLLQQQIEVLKEQIKTIDMKINYLLDNNTNK